MSQRKLLKLPGGGRGYVVQPGMLRGRSGHPENAVMKACAAWVTNNGDLGAFAGSLTEDGYSMVLVKLIE